MKNGYVYINTNKENEVLYVGVTADLERRAYEHKYRLDPPSSFCYKYWVMKLVYYEHFDDIKEAINREKQIKNLVRQKKIDLIEGMNPKWKDLYNTLFQ